eukprot:NODE_328_length_9539_cov_0.346716.p4 type:complete len:277 gc:universal NODE_328_length_9539_cov_0.346716:1658-828(-)
MSLSLQETVDRGLETLYSAICSLNLPYSTFYISSVILQRAYMMPDVKRRFKDRKFYDVAVGSLYIAYKLQEFRVNNDEIINVINRKAKKNEDSHLRSTQIEYAKWKRIVLYMEPYLLHQLNFQVDLQDPFLILTNIRRRENLNFAHFQLTYTILGDFCRTIICCKVKAATLVAASLFMAGCILKVVFFSEPISSELQGWWTLVELKEAELDLVESACYDLLKEYHRKNRVEQEIKVEYKELPIVKLPRAAQLNNPVISQVKKNEVDEELEEGEIPG